MSFKSSLKAAANGAAWLTVAPFAYPMAWISAWDGRHTAFQLGSHLMSLLPGILGVYLRRQYYRIVLGLKTTGFVIEFGAILAQRGTLIGNNVYIGPFCNVGLSTLEDDVLLGSNVDIVSGKHTHFFERTDVPIREQGGTLMQISIGKGAWIGNKAVVMESVAPGTIVGAGSVVTQRFEPLSIIAGNPARFIRMRTAETPVS